MRERERQTDRQTDRQTGVCVCVCVCVCVRQTHRQTLINRQRCAAGFSVVTEWKQHEHKIEADVFERFLIRCYTILSQLFEDCKSAPNYLYD